MTVYGITHCRKHLCEIPLDTLVCPECKREKEEEEQKRKHKKQIEEFRKIIREEIGNYFREEVNESGYGLPEALCCNCGQYFEYQKSDLELLKASTKNIYFEKCPYCDTFTVVEEY